MLRVRFRIPRGQGMRGLGFREFSVRASQKKFYVGT